MKNTLIIQFRTDGPVAEYDRLIGFEDALIQGYEQNHSGIVDGHDFGSRYINIFIFPVGSWKACIEVAVAYLKLKNMAQHAVVIKRLKSEKYEVVWPPNYVGDFERV